MSGSCVGKEAWGQRSEWFSGHRRTTGNQSTGYNQGPQDCCTCFGTAFSLPTSLFWILLSGRFSKGRWNMMKACFWGASILLRTTFPQLGSFRHPLEVKFLWLESAAWCFKEDVVSTLQSGWAQGREQSGTGICSGSLMRILMGLCAGKRERETHIHHVVRTILSRPKLRVEWI